MGELVGAFARDGNYYHDTCGKCSKHLVRYFLSLKNDYEYGKYLKSKLEDLGFKVQIYKKKERAGITSFEIRTCSINFIKLLKEYVTWFGNKTYSVRLKKEIKEYDKTLLFGFARGLMDTDGYVETSAVACACTSECLINNLGKIFTEIGITPKITVRVRKRENRRDLYKVRVKKEDLEIYQKHTGFSNPRKKELLLNILNKKSSKVY